MIKKIRGGKRYNIQGLDCFTPPIGHVIDFQTGALKDVGVLSRSSKKTQQYWERIGLPEDWERKRAEEKRIQEYNPSHIDPDLEEYRAQAWQRRLEGMWFLNDGVPTYITGLHYFYLNWVYIGGKTRNTGYPDYWQSDRDFFYFMQYVLEDESCFGMVYVTKRREGKALAIDTDIPTPQGFRKLEDIKEGDYVFDANGDPTLVTFATEIMHDHDCYKVGFDDGSSVVADAEHRWWVSSKSGRISKKEDQKGKAWHVETTEEMFGKPLKRLKENNFQTPMNGVVKYDHSDLPIDPYVLGVWLGDGAKSGSKITTVDGEIEDYLSSIYDTGHKSKISTYYKANKETGVPFRTELVNAGLLHNKHIPDEYMTSSYHQRIELIRGLMDSDGYVEKGHRGRMEFSQKRRVLCLQLKELLASIGVKSKMTKSKAKLYGKDCGDRYRLRFKTSLPVFKLSRKLERVDKEKRNYGWSTIRAITSIEKVDSVPVKCIQVDNPDHLFLCGRDYIVTHNTSKSVAFILEGVTRVTEANAGIQSKTEDDAKKVVYRDGVLKSFNRLPDFFQPRHKANATTKGVVFNDPKYDGPQLNGWIDFRASTDTAYDGTKLFRYVGDEIFKTTNSNIYDRHEIILPCLEDNNRNPYGKALYTSTVEEMEGRTKSYIDFWKDSNQGDRNKITKFTRSKVFRYFTPADEAMNRDVYGKTSPNKNRELLMAERDQVRNDPKKFNGRVRRNPLTIEEAFRVSSDNKVFDSMRLIDRHEEISWREDIYEVGNFIWKDGVKDSEVEWEPTRSGRWKVVWKYINDLNLQRPLQSRIRPWNDHLYAIGVDPYSHSKTEDYRNSDGAFYVYRKGDVHDPHNSNCFCVEYCDRPPTSRMFFEDLIKTMYYFGCSALIENNRNNILDYIETREYDLFAMKLAGRKEAGIPGSTKTHGDIIDYTESFIFNHIDKVCFPDLLQDWMNFDPFKTTEFDRAMAAGYTLIAANRYNRLYAKLEKQNLHDIKIFM